MAESRQAVPKHVSCLQDVYDWFTEGFDTQDLQEAEALLVTLGGKREDREKKSKSQKSELKIENPDRQES